MSLTGKEDDNVLLTALTGNDRQEAREILVERYMPLVMGLAKKYAIGRRESFDDLVQIGSIGLIKTIDRFDLTMGTKISTYATPNIIGEFRRHFRDKGQMVRLPRKLKELQPRLAEAIQALSKGGQKPTYHELAHYLEVSLEEVVEALIASGAQHVSSLDKAHLDDDDGILLDTIGRADISFDRAECWVRLEPILPILSERERTILYQRFFLGMSQTEIADTVGLSQMHISRLIRKSIAKLRQASDAGVRLPGIRPRKTTLNDVPTRPVRYKVKVGAKRAKVPETPRYRVKVGAKRARE